MHDLNYGIHSLQKIYQPDYRGI